MAATMSEVLELVKDIPPGAWVAVSEERHAVMAYGTDIATVVEEARAQGEELPLIVRVPEHPMMMFF